ncbi:MAG: hypothetical protein ACSHX7_10930 [Luteolibacter sp.]
MRIGGDFVFIFRGRAMLQAMRDRGKPHKNIVKQLPPDYTPFSFTGSADADGDRKADEKTGGGQGLAALIAFVFLVGLLIWMLF